MKEMEIVDRFIQSQKTKEVNPFITTRVMEVIDQKERGFSPLRAMRLSLREGMVVAAGFILAIALGIGVAGFLSPEQDNRMAVNDTQLESLYYYNVD